PRLPPPPRPPEGSPAPPELTGPGLPVPPYVLSNADLETIVDTDDQWITERTGIKERRIAGKGESTATLGRRAAVRALAAAGVAADDVDLLLVATATPDYPLPSAACILQGELGMRGNAAMDVIAGCAGFVYALTTAAAVVASGRAGTVLVVGADALSRITDYADRSTCILFGDGAGAAVLRQGDRGGLGSPLGWDGGPSGAGWAATAAVAGC